MTALTELLDKPIRDPQGDEVARVQDLVVRPLSAETGTGNGSVNGNGGSSAAAVPAPTPTHDANHENATGEPYPPVTGLVVRLNARHGARDLFIPWDQVRRMGTDGADLAVPAINVERFQRRDDELVLRESLFDRQVVDVEGRRVVRINDLVMREAGGLWYLVAVDIGTAALLRRAGGTWLEQRLAALLGREPDNRTPLIDWADVVPLADNGPSEGGAVRLRVRREKLAMLAPADLARVVEQLTPQQGAELLSGFDDARAADTLEELEDERQAQVLRAMDPERAADVLEEMEPDEATDALQSFSPEEAEELLKRMEPDEAEDVKELLDYPDDSVGGIMTNEYVAVPEWATARGVITALRAQARAAARDEADPLPDALPEIYIVTAAHDEANGEASHDGPPAPVNAGGATGESGLHAATEPVPLNAEGRLIGVLALRDLLLANPESALTDIMRTRPAVARPRDSARDAARVVAEDDLLALPVVDDAGQMLGIVMVDDAIDVILPGAWKKRAKRSFR